MDIKMRDEKKMILFENSKIRRVWHEDDWWFSVVDVVGVLVGNVNYRRYWSDLKIKLKEEGSELYDIIVQLKMKSADGKMYLTDCANKKGLFRIIQSIPSKKAEPFKIWLAKVGSERIDEIENPELAQERMKILYEQKGYPKSWIDKRLRGIAIRQDLTDEWKSRGVQDNMSFAILTNEISKATFGKTIDEYKKHKNLSGQNLRDHMDDIELILTMFGEASTTRLTRERDSQQFPKLKKDAEDGGRVAGNARADFEKTLGKSVVSKENYLDIKDKKELSK
jgi:DNA-damage-inducible protein D